MPDSGRAQQQHRSVPQRPKSSAAIAPTRKDVRNPIKQAQNNARSPSATATTRPTLQSRSHSSPLANLTNPAPLDQTSESPASTTTQGTFLFRSSVSDDRPLHTETNERSRAQHIHHPFATHLTLSTSGNEDGSSDASLQARSQSSLQSLDGIPLLYLRLVVVGATRVGKSTFVRLSSSTDEEHVIADSVTFAVDGYLCKVKFLEIDLEHVVLDDNDRIHWSQGIDLPGNPDGVILLYSVMDPASLKGVPDLLRVLGDASTTVILVATNCDNPPIARLVNPDAIANKAKEIMPKLSAYKSALYAESRPKSIIQALLSRVIKLQSFLLKQDMRRRSGSTLSATSVGSKSSPSQTVFDARLVARPRVDPCPSPDISRSNRTTLVTERSSLYVDDHVKTRDSLRSPSDLKIKTMISGLVATGRRSPRTFLDLDDSTHDEDEEIPGIESGPTKPVAKAQIPALSETGKTFDQLVERLLRPVPNKEDALFQQSFLAFYRLFAPPSKLLDAIIFHFEVVTRNPVTPWDSDTKLDRDLTVLETWIAQYPGDFAKTTTRRRLQRFLTSLVKDHGWPETGADGSMEPSKPQIEATPGWDWTGATAAAQQMSLALENVVEDDDTHWACADKGGANRSRANTFLSISSIDSLDERQSFSPPNGTDKAISHLEHDTKLIFGGQATVILAAIGRSRVKSDTSLGSSTTLVSIAESAHRQASLLALNPVLPFDKILWRSFMTFSDDQIACELTRIDWILFSAIRPRDLIRNVSISSTPPPPSTRINSSESVTRMIEHFNHLAFWVTDLILLRDKAKHRAQMLEKFMRVAKELRKLNNYNALGAFIAAIRGPSIARLTATRALVDGDVQKKFASLEVLMSTARGHWAYRFALENTEQETIPRLPFLPLHRRDLIVAESAGKTYLTETGFSQYTTTSKYSAISGGNELDGSSSSTTLVVDNFTSTSSLLPPVSASILLSGCGSSNASTLTAVEPKINWPKFAIMGETLAVLQRAQATPYTGFTANDEIRGLLLRGKVCKGEDELYERSVHLEAGGSVDGVGAGGQRVRRKIQGGLEKLGRLEVRLVNL